MEEHILIFSQLSLPITTKNDKNDEISYSVLLNNRTILFGTLHGRLVVTDLDGKIVNEFPSVSSEVTCISTNLDEKYALVCSKNGEIEIISLETAKSILNMKHSLPLTNCVLDPLFIEKGTPKFFVSDASGAIFKNSLNIFFRSTLAKIIEPQKVVRGMKWIKNALVYTTNEKIYAIDVSTEKNIYECSPPFIKRLSDHICSFVPMTESKIGVVIGNFFYELSFDKKRCIFFNLQKDVVKICNSGNTTIHTFTTKTGDEKIYVDQGFTSNVVRPPTSSKIVTMAALSDDRFIFVYPKSVYSVTFSTWEQRINTDLYSCDDEECIAHLNKWLETINPKEKSELVVAVVNHLLSKNYVKKASDVCVKYLDDAEGWDEAIKVFLRNGVPQQIAELVPIDILAQTTQVVDILLILLDYYPMMFCHVFEALPEDSFETDRLLQPVIACAKKDKLFNIPLMNIYHRMGKHVDAFNAGIKAKYVNLFDDIDRYKEYKYALNNFDLLYDTYGTLFTEFLVNSRVQLMPSFVLPKFGERKKEMLDYMHKLVLYNTPIPDRFRTELALLYIEFHHPATMDFLKLGQFFDYRKATIAAIKEKMWNEAAFLSRKTGALTEGMDIHLNNIKNPASSVEYAMKVEDNKVWYMLTEAAYKDEALLSYMIDNLPSLHIDPVDFVSHIPSNMAEKIDLDSSSAKILKEYRRSLATLRLTKKVISNDIFHKIDSSLRRANIIRK